MPTYQIETNRGTFEIEANREPTASEIESYISQQSATPAAPDQAQPMAEQAPISQQRDPSTIPELVAGNEQQMAQQRARNVQQQLGLAEPVSATETVSLANRLFAGFAPTAPEKKAYLESEYGKDSFIPLSSNRALVRIPDKTNGFKWVVDDPKGLDAGDIAEIASKGPEIATGIIAGLSRTPGTAGGIAKLAEVSGVSALASNVLGALQDTAFRAYTGQPINVPEILSRRAKGTALETVLGVAAPKAVEKVFKMARTRSALTQNVEAFLDEGKAAKKALQEQGYNPSTSAELADVIRNANPAKLSASEAGDVLAENLTQTDKALRSQSVGLAERAATLLEARTLSEIDQATSAVRLEPGQAGLATIGAVKQNFIDAKKATDALYQSAYDEIASAAKEKGVKAIVKLTESKKLVNQLESNLLKSSQVVEAQPTGIFDQFGRQVMGPETTTTSTLSIYQPFLTVIKQIKQAAGTPQELRAVGQLRTMIGEKIKNPSDLFPGLDVGTAKQLYKSLSNDIDNSVAAFTGPGSAKLKSAHMAYKAMISPVESNDLMYRIANGLVNNPEDVVKTLANGGTADWAAAKAVVPANTFNNLKRSVVDSLMGSAKVSIGNTEIADIGKLAQSLNAIDSSVKNTLFNGSNRWQFIEQAGRQANTMKNTNGLFTSETLPPISAINEAMDIAQREGISKADSYYFHAVKLAAERRSNMTSSLVSQINNGNVVHVAERPAEFFEGLVLSGKYRPEYVKSVIAKLPPEQQKNIADTAFLTLFEKARVLSQSTVESGKNTYSFDQMLSNVFKNKQQSQSVEAVIGKDRLDLIKNWTKYEIANSIQQAKASQQGRRITGLVGRLPYKNLAAAGFASYALEQASGKAFLSKATPANVALFADARLLQMAPRKTAAGITLIQKAMDKPGYGDYMQMMGDFSHEQQMAIDEYLLNR
jgi:hypothetical protein